MHITVRILNMILEHKIQLCIRRSNILVKQDFSRTSRIVELRWLTAAYTLEQNNINKLKEETSQW